MFFKNKINLYYNFQYIFWYTIDVDRFTYGVPKFRIKQNLVTHLKNLLFINIKNLVQNLIQLYNKYIYMFGSTLVPFIF